MGRCRGGSEYAGNVAKALQNAELVLIPNVGHNPHLEAPEIFNRELIRFLSSDPVPSLPTYVRHGAAKN